MADQQNRAQRNMKRKIIYFFTWLILSAMLVTLMTFAGRRQGQTLCRDVQILINYPEDARFVTEQDIRQYIIDLGDSVRGNQLSDIDIEALERLICQNPYISRAEVFLTLDGVVTIRIQQREPIARVYNNIKQSYYISDDGTLMPVNPGKPAHVPVVNGNINTFYLPGLDLDPDKKRETFDTAIFRSALYSAYRVASFVHSDPFFKAQIEQIYINESGDVELIPVIGRHLILLGDTSEMKNKFENLLIFYREGLAKEGWDRYDTINLKFHNQVICTKKQSI